MKTYLITEDELGAAELRAFTYDMALSTSGEYVLLPYLLRSAHHRKCFHFTQNPVVISVTNKHAENSREKGCHRTEALRHGTCRMVNSTSSHSPR